MGFAPPKYDLTRIGRLVFGQVAREAWGCVADERSDREAREARGNDGSFSGQHQPYTCRTFRGQDHMWGPLSDKSRRRRSQWKISTWNETARRLGWENSAYALRVASSNYCMDPVHHISRGQRKFPPISITLIYYNIWIPNSFCHVIIFSLLLLIFF